MEKKIIKYPCQWSFRIIGKNKGVMRRAVAEYMNNTTYQLTASNLSRSGKYVSLNLELAVLNEDVRNRIYIDLKSMPCVKMVL